MSETDTLTQNISVNYTHRGYISLTIMPKSCVVVGCTVHNMMTDKKRCFFELPKRILSPNGRDKWLQAIHRVNPDGSHWSPAKSSTICSHHFVTGRPVKTDENHPDFVPSIFPHKDQSQVKARSSIKRYQRYQGHVSKRQCSKRLPFTPPSDTDKQTVVMGLCDRIVRKLIRCIVSFTHLFQPLVSMVLKWFYSDHTPVPPLTDPVLLMSAVKIADQIRSKKISAVEVMKRFIARVKAVNPVVNAVVAERYTQALEEAQAIDDKLAAGDNSVKSLPLLGVPLSVKEAFRVKGMPNTSGLWSRRNHKALETAPVVQHLQAAGAIPFVMTNTSELCMWYESSNNVYGRTNNVYDTRRIVGGSSGGEGCILSTGGSVIGVGSDIGGSIRMPAFFNGVYGHKPSRGMVDNSGQYPPATGGQVELVTTGPLCRYAADILPVFKAMSGNPPQIQLDSEVDLSNLRYYVMEDDGGGLLQSNVHPDLRKAQQQAVAYLEQSLGVKVTKINLHRLKFSFEMWSARMSTAEGVTFSEFMAGEEGAVNGLKELGKWLLGQSKHTLPAIMLSIVECFTILLEGSNARFLQMLTHLEKDMKELLDDGGILFYQSHPCPAQLHHQPLTTAANFSYTAIFNALGLPVTQCPLGLSKKGLPVGMQIVGGMLEDRNTIAVARALEKGPGGWVSP